MKLVQCTKVGKNFSLIGIAYNLSIEIIPASSCGNKKIYMRLDTSIYDVGVKMISTKAETEVLY